MPPLATGAADRFGELSGVRGAAEGGGVEHKTGKKKKSRVSAAKPLHKKAMKKGAEKAALVHEGAIVGEEGPFRARTSAAEGSACAPRHGATE